MALRLLLHLWQSHALYHADVIYNYGHNFKILMVAKLAAELREVFVEEFFSSPIAALLCQVPHWH
jgi:hypothetical protein